MIANYENLHELYRSIPGSIIRLQKKTKKFKRPDGFSVRYLWYLLNPEDQRQHPGVLKEAELLAIKLLEEKAKEESERQRRQEAIQERLQQLKKTDNAA